MVAVIIIDSDRKQLIDDKSVILASIRSTGIELLIWFGIIKFQAKMDQSII